LNRFRLLLCKGIRAALKQGKLQRLPNTISVEQLLATAMTRKWRVYAKPPFGGVGQLLEYLSRYTYRVAITDDRVVSYENHQVTFRWRDSRHGNQERLITLDAVEFLRRFLMHVPPKGFVRIRSYGFLGNRKRKTKLERARQLIAKVAIVPSPEPFRLLRLCPACFARRGKGGQPHYAPVPDVASQLPFNLRPPPIRSAA
jgi:hypothetical protein